MTPIKPALFLSALVCLSAQALPTDRDQPIHIEADQAVRDQKQGITTYQGKVVMDQGSIHIEADKVVIYSQEKKVSRILATGAPARFQQQPAPEKPVIKANGQRLDYRVADDKLSIEGDASVEQDGSLISGDLINYNIHLAVVEAGALTGEQSQGRVKMVLQPQQTRTDSPAQPDARAEQQ